MSDIKKKEIKTFLDIESTAINTFRTITLFGKNSATYKFALCHTLMHQNAVSRLKYEDIQDVFLKEVIRHYQNNNHQFVKRENQLTRHIDEYLASGKSENDWSRLSSVASKTIFNDVFRAFQNVGAGTIDERYKLFEDVRKEKQIILTDNLLELLESERLKSIIIDENQARWHIVEEAWKANLSPNMLQYNAEDGLFYSESKSQRIGLRSAVDTLLPYQNGRCFFCNRAVSKFVKHGEDDFSDVDHFFPISKFQHLSSDLPNANGVWNLVIACKKCNRGAGGKFDEPPSRKFFENLLTRNILFFEEHKHSLKNSICMSLGANSKKEITDKMKNVYQVFDLIKGWEPEAYFYD